MEFEKMRTSRPASAACRIAAFCIAALPAFAAASAEADPDEELIYDSKNKDGEGYYKSWDLQYVTPAEMRDADPQETVPGFVDGSGKDAPAPIGPALGWPATGSAKWGRFKFWTGLWAAKSVLQPDIRGAIIFPPNRLEYPSDMSSYRAIWLRRSHIVPSERRGKRVMFHFADIRGCDCVVFVNRKRAGVIYRPEGEIDITKLVNFGASNEFLVFATCTGWNLPAKRTMPDGSEVDNVYNPRVGIGDFLFMGSMPSLRYVPQVYLTDIFANTSWRKKTLTVEAELSAARHMKVDLLVDVKDPDGNVVKSDKIQAKLAPGTTRVEKEIPWKDPVTWEIGRGYLYTLETTVVAPGFGRIPQKPVVFGFREIWREGKEIMMNGHKQCFRPVYQYGANENGYEFLSRMGFNTIHMSHVQEKDPKIDEKKLMWLSEHGMGLVAPTAIVKFDEQGGLRSNAKLYQDYESALGRNLKRYRNWPCIVMCYTGVNNEIQLWCMEPQWTGQGKADNLSSRVTKTAKKYNPNILFFSHASAPVDEVDSLNLYLNFTPLQEREEWMCKWAERGENPVQMAEFGDPYFQCWFQGGGGFGVPEWLAAYYGESAYDVPRRLMVRMKPGLYIRRVQFPHYWDFRRETVWRTNRGWRTAGENGGMVNFNIEEGYGMPGWHWRDKLWNAYGPGYSFPEKVPDNPDWLWPSFDIYKLGNQDFLGYIGGAPLPSDKTHGYFEGDVVRKNIVMRWDRFNTAKFSCEWSVAVDGQPVPKAAGRSVQTLPCAETVLVPVKFALPKTKNTVKGVITANFKSGGDIVSTDTFEFEVHPKAAYSWTGAPEIGLYDPAGKSEAVLKGLGIKNYRRLFTMEEGKDLQRIVVGKDALDYGALWIDRKAVRNGQRIMYLPQSDKGWWNLRLEGEGTMSRKLFLRDVGNPSFAGVAEEDMHDWAGAPQCEAMKGVWKDIGYGPVRAKGSRRGLRWMYDMALAAQTLNTPNVVGFIPQIDGEYDLNYSALMKFLCGKGSVSVCTLEFERRAGRDAAASAVAEAVFRDFLLGKETVHDRGLYALDWRTRGIAEKIGAKVLPFKNGVKVPPRSIVLAGPDVNLSYEKACGLARRGVNVVFLQHAKAATEAGLKLASTAGMFSGDPDIASESDEGIKRRISDDLYSVEFDRKNPLLRGLSSAHMRWRDGLRCQIVKSAPASFKIDCGGLVASTKTDMGEIVFCQLDPAELDGHGASGKQYENIRMSIGRMYQFWARLLTNLQIDPGDAILGRMTWAQDGAMPRHRPCPVAAVAAPVKGGSAPACHDAAMKGRIRHEQLATPAAGVLKESRWSWVGYRPDRAGNIDFGKTQTPEGADGVWVYTVYRTAGNKDDEQTLIISGQSDPEVYVDGALQPKTGRDSWRFVLPRDGSSVLTVVWKNPSGKANITLARTRDGKDVERNGPMPDDAFGVNLLGNGIFVPDPYFYTYW